jgi:hypothetical protein
VSIHPYIPAGCRVVVAGGGGRLGGRGAGTCGERRQIGGAESYSFWDHVIQISIRQMNFLIYFTNYEKLKSFVETFTTYNQILIFEQQLCTSNIDFYI